MNTLIQPQDLFALGATAASTFIRSVRGLWTLRRKSQCDG